MTTARRVAMSRLLTVGRQGGAKVMHEEINARGLTVAASASADIKAWAAIVDWSDDDQWEVVEAEEAKAVKDGWPKKKGQQEMAVAAGDARTIEGVEKRTLRLRSVSTHASPTDTSSPSSAAYRTLIYCSCRQAPRLRQWMGDLRLDLRSQILNGELFTDVL